MWVRTIPVRTSCHAHYSLESREGAFHEDDVYFSLNYSHLSPRRTHCLHFFLACLFYWLLFPISPQLNVIMCIDCIVSSICWDGQCLQCLACICDIASLFHRDLRHLSHLVRHIATVAFYSTIGCMASQVLHEIDFRGAAESYHGDDETLYVATGVYADDDLAIKKLLAATEAWDSVIIPLELSILPWVQ